MIPILYNLFQIVEAEETLPKSFYGTSITLISDKDIRKENNKPISFVSADAKILNKTLANQIQ